VHNHKAVGRGPDFGLISSHHHRSLVFIFSLVLSDRGKCKRSGKRENGNGGGGGGGGKTAVRSEESTRIGQRWLWVAFIRWEKSGNQLEV